VLVVHWTTEHPFTNSFLQSITNYNFF